MKKKLFVSAMALVSLLLASHVHAAKLSVQIKAPKESKELGYSLSVVGEFSYYNRFDSVYTSPTGKFELNLEPGIYTLVCQNPWTKRATYYVHIDNANTQITLNVELKPLVIPQKITKVQLVSDFNQYKKIDTLLFTLNEKKGTWNLPANKIPAGVKKYRVTINDTVWVHIPYLKVNNPSKNSSYENTFDKGPIVFNPTEFLPGETNEKAKYTATGFNEDFNELCQTIVKNGMLLQDSTGKMYSKIQNNPTLDPDVLSAGYDRYFAKYDSLLSEAKAKYGAKYGQFLIEVEFMLLQNHPTRVMQNLYNIAKNQAKAQQIGKSDEFSNLIKRKALLIKSVDKKSDQLNGTFANELSMLDYYAESLDLYDQLNLPIGYFKQFKEDLFKETSNQNIKAMILMDKARNLSYRNPEKASEVFQKIKTDYPNSKYVKDGSIDNSLKGLAVKEGVKAPEFSVKTFDNKEIKLSDYKGKFVFIDFWGTWCGPCKGEIPNVKKLSADFADGQLVVIGLMSDNEADAKKYIEKENILYANAIASRDLLASYGVNSYPTTLLINKEGVIIAKNLRGSDLTEQVKKAMGL